jgi:hypothetical protein
MSVTTIREIGKGWINFVGIGSRTQDGLGEGASPQARTRGAPPAPTLLPPLEVRLVL